MKDLKLMTLKDSVITTEDMQSLQLLTNENALAQRIVKLLLTLSGSDYFNPDTGTNLLSMYGVYNEKALKSVKLVLPMIVESFSKRIKEEQSLEILNGMNLKDEELLDSISIEDIKYDKEYNGWLVELTITNKAKSTIKLTIP